MWGGRWRAGRRSSIARWWSARDRDQLLAGLDELADGDAGDVGSVIRGTAAPAGKTVFVFPGQGSQWLGMGIELLDTAPVFAAQIERLRGGVRGIRRLVADRRPARRAGRAGPGPRRRGAAGAVRGDGVAGRIVEVGRGAPGRRDRPFARRDRRRLRRRCAVAARCREGGHAAQQIAVGAGRPRRHGVDRLRRRAGPGIVGALRQSGQHRRVNGRSAVVVSGEVAALEELDRDLRRPGSAHPPHRRGLCLAFG